MGKTTIIFLRCEECLLAVDTIYHTSDRSYIQIVYRSLDDLDLSGLVDG